MKLICGWCKKDLGELEPKTDPGVTHGICDECFKKQMANIKVDNKIIRENAFNKIFGGLIK